MGEAQRLARKQRFGKNLDVESDCSDDAASTAASSAVVIDEAEVERLAMLDKDVRKFAKVLRDIEKLESCKDLDDLQKAKVNRKADVEIKFDTAKGLAKSRARNQLRCQ